VTITQPGVYDMTADAYHAHPALSSSGARKLLPPSCPALFHYERSNPVQATPSMEFGSVTHDLLLGGGHGYEVLAYDSYRTKESQEKRDAIRAEGRIPILRHDYQVAKAMVSVVRAHPIAGKLFAGGKAEQSLFWTDEATGMGLRARVDYIKTTRRLIVADYKSAISVAPEKISRAAWDYGYAQQADFYTAGARALDLGPDPGFIIVSQMKEPPYLVTVGRFTEVAMAIGHDLNRRAIETYATCMRDGVWPGFDELADISLPSYIEHQWMKDML